MKVTGIVQKVDEMSIYILIFPTNPIYPFFLVLKIKRHPLRSVSNVI